MPWYLAVSGEPGSCSRSDLDAWNPEHDEFRRDDGFGLAHVGLAKRELRRDVQTHRKRNCRFKLDMSMVSMSMT